MSLCSINITVGISENSRRVAVENNRLIGIHGPLYDNLFVHKDQR